MTLKERYVALHSMNKQYEKRNINSYENKKGWTDYVTDNSLIFSHRLNSYTKETFTEGLHTHDYHELIFYISGNVEYICGDRVIKPIPFSVLHFYPGEMHTARLVSPSDYERYVFYFTDSFFEHKDGISPLCSFSDDTAVCFKAEDASAIKSLLESIRSSNESVSSYSDFLAKSYTVLLFAMIKEKSVGFSESEKLTDEMILVKSYIDSEYASMASCADVAKHFHYSREHMTRKFKAQFNIHISDYIAKRRVLESLPFLKHMSGAEVAFAVGFGSQSAFISAFKKNMGCLPSEFTRM